MKMTALSPRDSRIAAILLLLLALLLAYFTLLHWWFVAPLQQVRSEMADLRDTHSRYAAAIAEKPALQRRIAALGAGQAASSAFLAADDPNTAAADLMQRVVDVVAGNTTGGRCVVSQKMPLPNPPATAGEPYRKAAVSISLSCDVEPLAAVLQALEQGTPYLFVDDLSIYRNPVAAQQDSAAPLEVQFTLSGYVRPARNAPAPSSRSPDAAGAAP
ncbi:MULTISPECIES: type II secretion system protein GspM [unclassified Rhodanobacter]|uniref:type II secretion system protein GspM n=1 Tax=unclassified Rhodanobacter TaxID=2621553 RepID=UPI001BDDD5F9|nr:MULTISPECIES: type II secretion system protein GspM [unclassified Rhodanobacter]MBT2144311.1 general secretion pathway protein GspM [Rhodanobacter sp. LX-99]MBT2150022.1 general secretion pathway protein GspM [Rhodanobacter sp. LX-100]